VNGVNALVYTLAEAQVKLGCEVYLLLYGSPDAAALAFGRRTGVKFIVVPNSFWRYANAVTSLLSQSPPGIVHMHSVFIPRQALLAHLLRKAKIPYLVTPNGGFAPQVLARNRLKKTIYGSLIEKTRVRGAAGVCAVTPGEEGEIRSYVPDFSGFISCVPNAVDPDSLQVSQCRVPDSAKPTIVFLGRLDVVHKGIDILVDLGRRLPDAEFHLYGAEDPRTRAELKTLKRELPQNVFFHDPVFGSEKGRVLAAATLYIQASRWEAFGIAIAEAMYIGVPCAVADTVHMARIFERHDLGLVFEPDAMRASAAIRNALGDQALLKRWSARAQDFARQNFHPAMVAEKVQACYALAVARKRPKQPEESTD
jgi:glycosyltransferase involved in cell wall biosynthesis